MALSETAADSRTGMTGTQFFAGQHVRSPLSLATAFEWYIVACEACLGDFKSVSVSIEADQGVQFLLQCLL